MIRTLALCLLVMVYTSCKNNSEIDYKNSKPILEKAVKAMRQNWSNLNGPDKTYPYIIIDSTDVFLKETPYYLDEKQLLLVDDELNKNLQTIFKKSSTTRIDFYSVNKIEFIVTKDVSILRDKTTGFMFCKVNCDGYNEIRMLDENWYFFEKKISH